MNATSTVGGGKEKKRNRFVFFFPSDTGIEKNKREIKKEINLRVAGTEKFALDRRRYFKDC